MLPIEVAEFSTNPKFRNFAPKDPKAESKNSALKDPKAKFRNSALMDPESKAELKNFDSRDQKLKSFGAADPESEAER